MTNFVLHSSLNNWIFHFPFPLFRNYFVVCHNFFVSLQQIFKQVESEGEKVKFLKVKNLNNPLAS